MQTRYSVRAQVHDPQAQLLLRTCLCLLSYVYCLMLYFSCVCSLVWVLHDPQALYFDNTSELAWTDHVKWCVYIYIYIYTHVYTHHISLSLYVYIYIYTCTYTQYNTLILHGRQQWWVGAKTGNTRIWGKTSVISARGTWLLCVLGGMEPQLSAVRYETGYETRNETGYETGHVPLTSLVRAAGCRRAWEAVEGWRMKPGMKPGIV